MPRASTTGAVLVAAAAFLFVAAASSAALPAGCDRVRADDGLLLRCTLQPAEDTMRDTYARADVPDGRYGQEAKLDLPLSAHDTSMLGVILLEWPGLPRFPNATVRAANVTLHLLENDIPAGSGISLGIWRATGAWAESFAWDERPAPRAPWRTGPMDTWRLEAPRTEPPATAHWDVTAHLQAVLVQAQAATGFVISNTTTLTGGPFSSPTAVLGFHSSRAQAAFRPTLALEATLSAPMLRSLDWSGTMLVADGAPTGARVATNGERVERLHAVVDDTGATPAKLLLNHTFAGSRTTRTIELGRAPGAGPGLHYRYNGTVGGSAGEHTLAVFARDADGYPLNVSATGSASAFQLGTGVPVLRIDHQDPVVASLEAPSRVVEGERARVVVTASDPGNPLPLAVNATLRVGTRATDAAFHRTGPTTYASDVTFAHAGDASLHVTIADSAGNAVARTHRVHVVDVSPPTLGAGMRFATDVTSRGAAAAESDGPIVLLVPASDATAVTVKGRLSGPALVEGQARPDADGVARLRFVPPVPGWYNATVEASNADGATAIAGPVALRVLPRAAPQITIQPTVGPGVLPRSPLLAFSVEDVSLDPDGIRVEATADGARLDPGIQKDAAMGRAEVLVILGPQTNGTRLVVTITATDQLGLIQRVTGTWVVDGAGPRVGLAVDGASTTRRGVLHVAPDAKLVVEAADALLGTRRPQIVIQDSSGSRTIAADRAVAVASLGVRAGETVTIRGSAEDDAGNAGLSPPIGFSIDGAPPRVVVSATAAGLRISGADDAAGMHRLSAELAIGDGPFVPVGERVSSDGAPLLELVVPTPAARGTPLRLAYAVQDRLGNADARSVADPLRMEVPNHPPAVQVVSPASGARLGGEVRLHYDASDLDGDRLAARVVLERVLGTRTEPVAQGVRESPVRIDTARFLNGPHVLVLTVDDGEASSSVRIPVTLSNPGRDAGDARLVPTRSGTIVEVPVARPLVALDLVVRPPRGPPVRIQLGDAGVPPDQVASDGVWSAAFPADAPGTYSFAVEGVAVDGSSIAASVGSARVPGFDASILVPWLVGAAVLAGAGGVGAAAWARRPR